MSPSARGGSNSGDGGDPRADGDLADLLQELRILLPASQMLTAFLTILPFSSGFAKIEAFEQWTYVAMFACSVTSLVLFSAPAAQHRLERPLRDRARFKQDATRLIVVGLVPLSLALILATHLVIGEVVGERPAIAATAVVALVIAATWWVLPLAHRATGTR